MTETDTFYVGRCMNGHPDDFRFLVERYQGALLGHLVSHLRNRDHAEEAAQESLVRAYFNIQSLQKPERFFGWLLGISDRVAKEYQRKDLSRRRRESSHSPAEQRSESSFSQDAALEAAVAQLPENYRQLVLLRYYSQMSCKQISELLEQPLGTVTKTLSRAYGQLRQSMTQQDAGNESEVAK